MCNWQFCTCTAFMFAPTSEQVDLPTRLNYYVWRHLPRVFYTIQSEIEIALGFPSQGAILWGLCPIWIMGYEAHGLPAWGKIPEAIIWICLSFSFMPAFLTTTCRPPTTCHSGRSTGISWHVPTMKPEWLLSRRGVLGEIQPFILQDMNLYSIFVRPTCTCWSREERKRNRPTKQASYDTGPRHRNRTT